MRPPFSRTLFELVCEQAERFPERIAVICGERAISYRDLADGAGRIAAALKAHGIGRGERVGHPRQQPAGMARSLFRRRRARRHGGAVQHLVEAGRARLSARQLAKSRR